MFLCMCECSLLNKKSPIVFEQHAYSSSIMLQGRRQDGANQGWYVHRQGEGFAETTYANKREVAANSACCCDCHRLMKCLKCADFG